MNNRKQYPKNWEQLRVLIKIRDKFTCTICGKKESELRTKKGKPTSLHCMHLDGNSYNNVYTLAGDVFNNVDNNLASGCPDCHRLYDRRNNVVSKYVVKQNHQIIDLSFQIHKFK